MKIKADLFNDEGLKFAAWLVSFHHLSFDTAIQVAKECGYEITVSLSTFRRYMRNHSISRGSECKELREYQVKQHNIISVPIMQLQNIFTRIPVIHSPSHHFIPFPKKVT